MLKTEQVKEYIQRKIAQGDIKKGQRLPGCRTVAEELSVNKITVIKAYHQLELEHILYSVPRGGYYLIGMEEEEATELLPIDFMNVKPDHALIPYQAFSHAINRSIEEYKKKLFVYDTPFGLPSLRETLQQRFEQNGVYASTSQILITHGAQQGIYLILKTLFQTEDGGKLLIESPTYSCALDMANDLRINYTSIARNADGIDFKKLEQIFKTDQIKVFYLMPRYQNPTGYSLAEKDKVKLTKLCSIYHVFLLEDDYLGDLCDDKRNLPLHYYDTNKITFYVCSFSKTFMPGIRLGAVVLPASYTEAVAQAKYMLDLCTSSISQSALDYYIRSGMYDQHLRKTRACYQDKLNKVKAILAGVIIPDFYYHVPKQGLFIWLKLPMSVSLPALIMRLSELNILAGPSSHYYPGEAENTLRLCISGVKKDDLDALYTILKSIQVLV